LAHGITGLIGSVCIAYGLFSHRDNSPFLNLLLCGAFIIGGLLLLFPEVVFSIAGLTITGVAFLFDRKLFPGAPPPVRNEIHPIDRGGL
ncbi:MAG TPA: hypothetical protein PLD93_04175, partial [Synergistaceae bacterium]|nr:hypothetical protein [Synergistaceae bacterium]